MDLVGLEDGLGGSVFDEKDCRGRALGLTMGLMDWRLRRRLRRRHALGLVGGFVRASFVGDCGVLRVIRFRYRCFPLAVGGAFLSIEDIPS